MNFQETTSSGRFLRPLRRIRKSGTEYERLQRPEGILAGEPIPSVEGWVLLLGNLPESTRTVDVKNLFSSANSDPEYFGNVSGIKLPLDDYGNCSGWALVELDSKCGFDRAIETLHGSSFFLNDQRSGGDQEGLSESTDAGVDSPSRSGAEADTPLLLKVTPAFIGEEDAHLGESGENEGEEELSAENMKRGRENEENEIQGDNAGQDDNNKKRTKLEL